jgi:hypothetical protein
MNILIVVASSRRELIEFVSFSRKASIVPPEVLRKGYLGQFKWNVQVNAVDVKTFSEPGDFHDFILSRCEGAKILLVLLDEGRMHLSNGINTSALFAEVDHNLLPHQFQNYLSAQISRMMRSVNYIGPMFEDLSDSVLLSLPLRNFCAPEINSLRDSAVVGFKNADFAATVDNTLSRLRKRLRPRKRSVFKNVYAVDDRGRFFVLGKELHARVGSGGDHKPSCTVTSMFRLGFRIDDRHHYNVSEGEGDNTSVSGTFVNCHDMQRSVGSESHLNMFSNDFF